MSIGGFGWLAFGVVVLALLALDLGMHRGGHISRRSSLHWTLVWIGAGLCFGLAIWVTMGALPAQEYLAAYVMEKSLSVDNLFVFLIVFQALRVPEEAQRQALYWGILGAIVLRALFVWAGTEALDRWDWVNYVFGGILLLAAFQAAFKHPTGEEEPGFLKWMKRKLPVAQQQEGTRFFTWQNGRRVVTPMFLAIAAIELTDIAFAIDSVPAALAITRDPFLVYSSNVFAILGLRSLYAVLAHSLLNLRYLHFGLAGVLAFAAAKMLLSSWVHLHPLLSVAIILAMVGLSVAASLRADRRDRRPPTPRVGPPNGQPRTA
jgi:tellurite resistance protein TerC